jgi:hypothetical protein
MRRDLVLLKLLFSVFVFTSCTTVKETIYLQDVTASGPINTPPVRITKNKTEGQVTVSPRILINTNHSIAGNTKGERYRDNVQDSLFNPFEKNLRWEFPDFIAGLDFDFALSKSFSLAGGFNYAHVNQTQLLGGSLGIAFFKEKNQLAFRFDAGIMLQQIYFDAKTVVVTTIDNLFGDPETSVIYYRDRDKNSGLDLYAMLTFNTAMNEYPFNFFLSAGYFNQTVLNFEPQTTTDLTYLFILSSKTVEDTRGETSAAFLSLTPGVFYDFSETARLIVGARLLFETGLDKSHPDFLVLPHIQFDLSF